MIQTIDSKVRSLQKEIFGEPRFMGTANGGPNCAAGRTRLAGWATDGERDPGADAIGDELTRPEDIKGRQINPDQWTRTFMIGYQLMQLVPRLDTPTVVFYPEGHTGLQWSEGEGRALDLMIRDGDVFPYKWMQRTESGERVIQSDSLNDVAESLRTTFARNW